jgi:hypothetical protein
VNDDEHVDNQLNEILSSAPVEEILEIARRVAHASLDEEFRARVHGHDGQPATVMPVVPGQPVEDVLTALMSSTLDGYVALAEPDGSGILVLRISVAYMTGKEKET